MFDSAFSSGSERFLSLSRNRKRLLIAITDSIAAIVALWLSFALRLGEIYLPVEGQLWIFVLAPILTVPIFIRLGLYRAITRYLGIDALLTIIKAVALYALIFAVIVLIFKTDDTGLVPRTVYGINGLVMLLFAGGSRFVARWWFFNAQSSMTTDPSHQRYIPPVIIYGAGSSGVQLAAALKMGYGFRPVAFIDEKSNLHRQQINGLHVHAIDDLTYLIDKYDVHDVLLALPSASRARRREIITLIEPYAVHVRSLPGLVDIASGKVKVSDIQEVDIGDLLGRDPVEPIQQLLQLNVTDKAVMITGAGGSIGTELCRQILQLKPSIIVLFELNEYALYAIERELKQLNADLPVIAALGSVLDQARIERLCKQYQIQTIYHAAAYKHVPLVEKNIGEGVKNNVFGTLNCAQAAISADVETFVLISTDKAVRPTNIMGASKRLAELVLQGLATQNKTRFTMVRFGNVLDSSGSVVPLFREQILAGGPVTVTDQEVTRYFMTIPEAAELVIQAGAMGQGGDVFVLDMGESIRIDDLARRMIKLSGFSVHDDAHPDGDIEINYTGLRPGEKLYEELLIGNNVSSTDHQKIMRAEEAVIAWDLLTTILAELEQAYIDDDSPKITKLLNKWGQSKIN